MSSSGQGMKWTQKVVRLSAKKRGCHLVTGALLKQVPEIKNYQIGIANFFIQHTSASLSINENCDPDVRSDMEDALNRVAPENVRYRHADEGKDDMPAHVKATLVGSNLTIPITNGSLNLGTWQGIYLCEHRNYGGDRKVVVTLQGC